MGRKRTITFYYECGAPDALFAGRWEDVPDELKKRVTRELGCDGGGNPGTWCEGCQWEIEPEVEEE